ncbi:NAD(P)-binding protein [Martensiomyces pterosporus]|nr:NAD(P)-binding protein [Martensiomyces pterosporus]
MSYTLPTPTFKNVVLIGATGDLGALFINAFKRAGSEFNVTIFTRKESETKAIELVKGHTQFSVRAVDYNNESDLVNALQGQEVVLNITGFPGLHLQHTIIAAAEKAGVKWYLPSELGSDLSKPENRNYAFFATKLGVRDSLEKSSLAHTYIVTGGFADQFITPFHDWDTEKHTIIVPGDGNTKISFTLRKDVASYALAVLRRYDQFKNTTVRLATYTLSYNDWVSAVENATGTKYAVTNVPVEVLKERVAANVDNTFSLQWVADQLHISFAEGDVRVDWGTHQLDNDRFAEVSPTPLEDYLADLFRN